MLEKEFFLSLKFCERNFRCNALLSRVAGLEFVLTLWQPLPQPYAV